MTHAAAMAGGARAMQRGTAWWRRLGLRLALAALTVQVAIPLLIAVELKSAAAATETADAVIAQSLCLHDSGAPHDGAPHPDCNLACCPLCAALAAAATLGTPAQDAPPLLVSGRATQIRFALWHRFAGAAPPHAYRSRAPPVA